LAVLIGVLNFVELQGDEIKNVLRDHPDKAHEAAVMMLAALIPAVLSIFFGKGILTVALLLSSLLVAGFASFLLSSFQRVFKLRQLRLRSAPRSDVGGLDSLSLTVNASRVLRTDLIGVTVLAVAAKSGRFRTRSKYHGVQLKPTRTLG
jgi:hypothetical protein